VRTAAASLAAAVLAVLVPVTPAVAAPARHLAKTCGPVITEPLAEPPWPLLRLRPDLAWPLSEGAGVRVAVIDSGVSPNHPSLAPAVLPGADFAVGGGGNGECDENGHGTLIAGIIAGRETVSDGYSFHGIAPQAEIVPVRVLRDQQRSFEDDLSPRIANAIRWAVDVGHANVLNLSLTTTPTPQLESAIRYALDRNVVVVAAAGNEGDSQPGQLTYPAAYNGVVAVAGVDTNDQHVQTSSPGNYVDIAAPGIRIAGPAPAGGGYVFSEEGGTSFAAAYVSGVAALLLGHDHTLTPAQVEQRITRTADHPADEWDSQVGYGVVNPARAVGALGVATGSPRPASGQVRLAAPAPDPQHEVRLEAAWISAVGLAMAILVVLAVPVARRGRQRRWRSGPLS
jgi:type VII secretion-associated serine protease mycosin